MGQIDLLKIIPIRSDHVEKKPLKKPLHKKCMYQSTKNVIAQSAGAVEYTDCFSAEG